MAVGYESQESLSDEINAFRYKEWIIRFAQLTCI